MLENDVFKLQKYVFDYLYNQKNIHQNDLAEMVLELQQGYVKDLTLEHCNIAIKKVMDKREILYPIATGINLDKLAQQNALDEPLLTAVKEDYGLYGVDESLAMSMTHPYGTIAITNFGFLDKAKHNIAKKLDDEQKHNDIVNTFIDDIISAIIANASALIAHNDTTSKDGE